MDKMINKSFYLHPSGADGLLGLCLSGAGMGRGVKAGIDFKNPRKLKDYAFVRIAEGSAIFWDHNGKSCKASAGDIFVLFPGVPHAYKSGPSGWTEEWVLFNGEYMDMIVRNGLFSPSKPVLRQRDSAALAACFREIIPAAGRNIKAETLPLLFKIILLLSEKSGPEEKNLAEARIERALKHIDENAEGDIDFKALSAKLFMSYPHFRKIFKKEAGCSPHQRLLSAKINKAKILLGHEGYSVKRAALELGFEDQYYFSRLFKSKTGCAPSDWTGM